jgi:hypothetical protein
MSGGFDGATVVVNITARTGGDPMTTTALDVSRFLDRIRAAERVQLIGVLDAIAARDARGTADAKWWESTVQVESRLRAGHRRRDGSAAAQQAATAVRTAALRLGLGSAGSDETRALSRSAGEAARALVAGGDDVSTSFLVGPWTASINGLSAPAVGPVAA